MDMGREMQLPDAPCHRADHASGNTGAGILLLYHSMFHVIPQRLPGIYPDAWAKSVA